MAARTRQPGVGAARSDLRRPPTGLLVIDGTSRIVQITGLPAACTRMPRSACGAATSCRACAGRRLRWRVPRQARQRSSVRRPADGRIVEVTGGLLPVGDGPPLLLLVERVATERRKLRERVAHQDKMAAFGLLAAGSPTPATRSRRSSPSSTSGRRGPGGRRRATVSSVRTEIARLERSLPAGRLRAAARNATAPVSVHGAVQHTLAVLRHDRAGFIEVAPTPTRRQCSSSRTTWCVVLNLALNAVDAMPSGAPWRSDRPRAATWSCRCATPARGSQALARLRAVLRPPGKGSGLRLAVSRDIVAASTLAGQHARGGTTVTVRLPPTPGSTGAPPRRVGRIGVSGERILVVEDERAAETLSTTCAGAAQLRACASAERIGAPGAARSPSCWPTCGCRGSTGSSWSARAARRGWACRRRSRLLRRRGPARGARLPVSRWCSRRRAQGHHAAGAPPGARQSPAAARAPGNGAGSRDRRRVPRHGRCHGSGAAAATSAPPCC